MSITRLHTLIARFHDKTISEAEHAELLSLLAKVEHMRTARQFFKDVMDRKSGDETIFDVHESEALLAEVRSRIQITKEHAPVGKLPVLKWAGMAAAACLLIVSGYWMLKPAPKEVKVVAQQPALPADILPGKRNKAVLILADNSQIELDSSGAGVLGKQGSSMIRKAEDGQIVYEQEHGLQEAATVYNILEIPIGGEYQLTLSDGSKVWLNSASRLKFPVNFSGGSREVELTGEAYFEIAQNKAKPFRVRFNTATIEVLGTHFNVNAYDNDNTQAVTLLEGSVKVSSLQREVKIKPGQQAILAGEAPIQVKNVDTDEAIAWKDGYFMFVDEDIKSIMKKLARWYGFTAEYQANVDNERFGGVISKFKNISEVLKMFETTGTIRFNIIPGEVSGKGRKIIVMK